MSNAKAGQPTSESQQVDSLITDLLTALQPAFITHSKTAMDEFSAAFFSKSFDVTLEDALMLLTGDLSILRKNNAPSQLSQVSNPQGLLSAAEVFTGKYNFLESKVKTALLRRCGKGHSFGNKLRKSSEMALALLSQLVDPEYNTFSSHVFCKALAYSQLLWPGLRLAEHAQSSSAEHKRCVSIVSNALEQSVELFEQGSRPASPVDKQLEEVQPQVEEASIAPVTDNTAAETTPVQEQAPETLGETQANADNDMVVETMELDQSSYAPGPRKSTINDLKAAQAYIRRNSNATTEHKDNNSCLDEEKQLLNTFDVTEQAEESDDENEVMVMELQMTSLSVHDDVKETSSRSSSGTGVKDEDTSKTNNNNASAPKPKPGGFRAPPPPPPPRQPQAIAETTAHTGSTTTTTTANSDAQIQSSESDTNQTPVNEVPCECLPDRRNNDVMGHRNSWIDVPSRQRQSSLIACDALAFLSSGSVVDPQLDPASEEGLLVAVHGGVPIPQTETNPFVRIDSNSQLCANKAKPTSIGNTSSFFSPRKPTLRPSQGGEVIGSNNSPGETKSMRLRKNTPSRLMLLNAVTGGTSQNVGKNTPITRTLLDFFRNRKPPTPTVIFGKSLTDLHNAGFCDKDYVPYFIKDLCTYIVSSDERCETEGLFRVNGDKNKIEELKKLIDSGEDIPSKLHNFSPLEICASIKLWFRSLPQPFFSREITSLLVDAYQAQDVDLIYSLLNCRLLSVGTRGVLQYTMFFCSYLSAHRFRASSKLTPLILANVIAPNLAPPVPSEYNAIARDLRAIIEVLLLVMQSVCRMSDVIKVGYKEDHDLASRIMLNHMEKERMLYNSDGKEQQLQNPLKTNNNGVFDQVVSKQGVFFISDTGMLVADVSENTLDSEQYHQQRTHRNGGRNRLIGDRKIETIPIESKAVKPEHDVKVSDDKLLQRCKDMDKSVAKLHMHGVGVAGAVSSGDTDRDEDTKSAATSGIQSVSSFFSPVSIAPTTVADTHPQTVEDFDDTADDDQPSNSSLLDMSTVELGSNDASVQQRSHTTIPVASTTTTTTSSNAQPVVNSSVEVIKLSTRAFQHKSTQQIHSASSEHIARIEPEPTSGAFSSFTIARVSVKPNSTTPVYNSKNGSFTRSGRTASGMVIEQDSSVHAKRKRKMMRAALLMGDYTPVMEAVNQVASQSTPQSVVPIASNPSVDIEPIHMDCIKSIDVDADCCDGDANVNTSSLSPEHPVGISRTLSETSEPPPPPPMPIE